MRAAPSTGQAPTMVQGCAMERDCSSKGEAGEDDTHLDLQVGWMPCWQPLAMPVQDLSPGPCSAHAGSLLGSEVPPLLTPTLASRSQPSFLS